MICSSRIDKLEQWALHRAVKDEIKGSILGSNKQKVFFHLKLSLLYRLSIPICFIINQLKIKSRNHLNKAETNETVKISMFRISVMLKKRTETLMANQLEEDAETTKGNLKNA